MSLEMITTLYALPFSFPVAERIDVLSQRPFALG